MDPRVHVVNILHTSGSQTFQVETQKRDKNLNMESLHVCPQLKLEKTANLKTHNASPRTGLQGCGSAIVTITFSIAISGVKLLSTFTVRYKYDIEVIVRYLSISNFQYFTYYSTTSRIHILYFYCTTFI